MNFTFHLLLVLVLMWKAKKKNQYLGRGILQDKNVEYSYPVRDNYSMYKYVKNEIPTIEYCKNNSIRYLNAIFLVHFLR